MVDIDVPVAGFERDTDSWSSRFLFAWTCRAFRQGTNSINAVICGAHAKKSQKADRKHGVK